MKTKRLSKVAREVLDRMAGRGETSIRVGDSPMPLNLIIDSFLEQTNGMQIRKITGYESGVVTVDFPFSRAFKAGESFRVYDPVMENIWTGKIYRRVKNEIPQGLYQVPYVRL